MKKILFIAIFGLISVFSFAGGNQSETLKRLINRKVIYPSQLVIKEKITVEVQIEIMSDGCLAITASKGDPEVVNYIAERINSLKIPCNLNQPGVFIYKFTFEKENKK